MTRPRRAPRLAPRAALLLVLAAACTAPRGDERAPGAPYALVLGTAQDGGVPQIACDCPRCGRARREPRLARRVASLALVDPASGRRWLLDATPDLAAQVELVDGRAPRPAPGSHGPGRPPLFDGIWLTHAHVGHYAGLLQLGKEAYAARGQPVHVSERMEAFLRSNEPWRSLVDGGHLALVRFEDGVRYELAPGLFLTPLRVPHREELSDAYAFRVAGPERSLVYLPDIDRWDRWRTPIEELLAGVDLALVDGTFHDGGELPERDLASIPHPFVVDTLARLAPLPLAERQKVLFTHLNHSNPLVGPGPAASAVRAAGMRVAREGEALGL